MCIVYTVEGNTKFRFLKVQNLKQEDKDELITRLELDTNRIKMKFAGLVFKITTALEESDAVTCTKIKTYLIQGSRKDLADCVDPHDTVSMAMLKLTEREPWSFFDYEILEEIVHDFCGNKPVVQDFKDYKSHLQAFCERRLDEIPLEYRSLEHIHSESLICLKFDKNFFNKKIDIKELLSREPTNDEELPSLSTVKRLQLKLSELLGIDHLILLNIEMGCIELTFRHFNEENPLLLLSAPQKICLALLGVRKIHCDTESYDLNLYITPPSKFKGKSLNLIPTSL